MDVDNFQLQHSEDQVFWHFGKNKVFSVNSLYNALTQSDSSSAHKIIWKSKVPPKIKIFIWLMTNDAILTKDNRIRRKWVGDPKCHFCDQTETVDHLFFTCHIAKVIWGVIAIILGATNIPTSILNVGNGVSYGSHWARNFICGVCQLCAGLSGRPETGHALMAIQ